MAAVIADPAEGAPAPARRGRKKLFIIVGAMLLLVLLLGGGAAYYLKKKAHAAAEAAEADGDGSAEVAAAVKPERINPPTYLPLDPFVVNLADRDSDRYAQIGITLELQDPAFAERVKAYMPAVRNAILLVITRKTSRDLLDGNGKEELAEQIRREAVRPMGIEVAPPKPVTPAPEPAASGTTARVAAAEDEVEGPQPKQPKKKPEAVKNPVTHVHFSSFIIQ